VQVFDTSSYEDSVATADESARRTNAGDNRARAVDSTQVKTAVRGLRVHRLVIPFPLSLVKDAGFSTLRNDLAKVDCPVGFRIWQKARYGLVIDVLNGYTDSIGLRFAIK